MSHVTTAPLAGERNIGTANDYMLTRDGGSLAIISKTTAATIGAGAANDTRFHLLHVYGTLTGTCVITGFTDSDGTAQSITIPAATAAMERNFGGVLNAAGAFTVTCSNAADDNLVGIVWSAV